MAVSSPFLVLRRGNLFAFALLLSFFYGEALPAALGQNLPSAPHPSARAKAASGRGAREGIQISGEWVIEVRDRAGKVKVRREAENAIQPAGMLFLGSLIAGNNPSGGLIIGINGNSSADGGPCSLNGGGSPCGITAPANQQGYIGPAAVNCDAATTTCFPNLVITAPSFTDASPTGTGGAQIILSGSALASFPTGAAGGTITDVETLFTPCEPTNSPSACTNYYNVASKAGSGAQALQTNQTFTQLTLDGGNGDPAPIPFLAGDTITVMVTLSFSSPSLSSSASGNLKRR